MVPLLDSPGPLVWLHFPGGGEQTYTEAVSKGTLVPLLMVSPCGSPGLSPGEGRSGGSSLHSESTKQ